MNGGNGKGRRAANVGALIAAIGLILVAVGCPAAMSGDDKSMEVVGLLALVAGAFTYFVGSA